MALVTGRRSACNEAARKAQQAELMKLTPLERMKIALRTGHTAYRLRDLGAKHHVPKR